MDAGSGRVKYLTPQLELGEFDTSLGKETPMFAAYFDFWFKLLINEMTEKKKHLL